MINLFRRLKFIYDCDIQNGFINIKSGTKINCSKSSSVSIKNGAFQFGYPLRFSCDYPSQNRGLIKLGNGSRLIVEGSVTLGPGSAIVLGEGAVLRFGGDNVFAHNTMIFCHKSVVFERGAAASWNCVFMDWDGHEFRRGQGERQRVLKRPLLVGKNVGVQMNVLVPRGVSIGDNSIVSAGTVLRKDVPSNTLVYSEQSYRMKNGYQSGIKKIN